MDLYAWNPDGFVEPKPISTKWTLKNADRNLILLGHDLNEDGLEDLILGDETGIHAYFRGEYANGLPFSLDGKRTLYRTSGQRVTIRENRARKDKDLVLVAQGGKIAFWKFYEGEEGHWYLRRLF